MIFIKHENFPDSAANLIIHYDRLASNRSILKFPHEEYGVGVKPEEWMKAVGNQAQAHRPVILTMDDGIKGNAMRTEAMRECGCIFVMLAKKWSVEPFPSFAWKIIKAWPEIVRSAETAHSAQRLCKIEISIQGKPLVINF